MTKREQLKRNVIQYLQKEIEEVENFDDQTLARFFALRLFDCNVCVLDGRKCDQRCRVQIYDYLKNHGDEEIEQ